MADGNCGYFGVDHLGWRSKTLGTMGCAPGRQRSQIGISSSIFVLKAGQGSSIYFLHDVWDVERTLREIFPQVCNVTLDKDATNDHFWVGDDRVRCHFQLIFPRSGGQSSWHFIEGCTGLVLKYRSRTLGFGYIKKMECFQLVGTSSLGEEKVLNVQVHGGTMHFKTFLQNYTLSTLILKKILILTTSTEQEHQTSNTTL